MYRGDLTTHASLMHLPIREWYTPFSTRLQAKCFIYIILANVITQAISVTVLDYAFLATITDKANDGTVIYADRCVIGMDELAQMGIVFKKIPRDISRL